MVVVHVKAADEQQFLYDCCSTSTIDEMAGVILTIHGLQSQIQRFSLLLRQRLLGCPSFSDSYPDAALALGRCLSGAETYVSKDQVEHNKFLSFHSLKAHVKSIEKEVEFAQSKGFVDFTLPQPSSGILVDSIVHLRYLSGQAVTNSSLQPESLQLWWAGKQLVRGKRLCDYIGTNEKTKIVITLMPSSYSSS